MVPVKLREATRSWGRMFWAEFAGWPGRSGSNSPPSLFDGAFTSRLRAACSFRIHSADLGPSGAEAPAPV